MIGLGGDEAKPSKDRGSIRLGRRLLAARFEPDEIRLKQVQFRGVFDEDDPLVLGNESRKRRRERGLTAAGTAADQERLLSQDIVFETVGKLGGQAFPTRIRSSISKWRELNLRIVQRNSVEATGRDDRGDAAAVRQTRIQNGLRFGNVVSQAPSDVLDGNEQRPLAQATHLAPVPKTRSSRRRCALFR